MMINKYRSTKDKKCLTAAADIFKLFKYFIIRDSIEIVFHNPIISLFSNENKNENDNEKENEKQKDKERETEKREKRERKRR